MSKKSIFLALFISVATFTFGYHIFESINWNLKSTGVSITFQGGRVKGNITGIKATLLFDEANPEKSHLTAVLDVNTVTTGSGLMDKHAKSESGLNAEKFKTITFESTAVLKKPEGYHALGKLTLKGVSKEIVLPFTFENKGTEGLFKGKITLFTKDYGITRWGTPDQLDIDIVVPVSK